MKKLFVSLLMLMSVVSFANTPDPGDKVNAQIKAALAKEFAGAQYVVWQSLKDHQLVHAKFIYNNEQINAFFEEDGKLIATGRYIALGNLPLAITKQLNAEYGKYDVKDAIEYSRLGETSYVISLENEKTRIVLEAYSSGSMYVFKKVKKNLSAGL